MYRELNPNEIVKSTDEVLNHTDGLGNFNETEQQDRNVDVWTGDHAYTGLAVKDCKGCLTDRPRIFRRRIY